ncbi:MAG: hypothetical protein JW810_07510 [Sedimentisphaerales bacterium]|nr:hypothetical protein [Sedimentisphaerales bacterium]
MEPLPWTIFYRLLDLPEQIDDPTHYHLLGLDPDGCAPEVVDQALLERKKRLRQGIPGPHFIPLVLRFESERLEPAAAVLRDPDARRRYNEQLRRQASRGEAGWLKAERARVLRRAQELVTAALNPDGSLEDDKRPVLAGQLQQMGFSAGDIRVLFEGIPRPSARGFVPNQRETEFFRKAVELAVRQGRLLPDDEVRLGTLAEHLGIAPDQACRIIARQVSAAIPDGFLVDEDPLFPSIESGQAKPGRPTSESAPSYTYTVAPPATAAVPDPLSVTEGPGSIAAGEIAEPDRSSEPSIGPSRTRRWILQRLMQGLIPAAALVVFVWFLAYNLREPIPNRVRPPAGETAEQPADDGGKGDSTALPPEAADAVPPAVPDSPAPAAVEPEPELILSDRVRQVRQTFQPDPPDTLALADLAMELLATCARVEELAWGQSPSESLLGPLLRQNRPRQRLEMLLQHVDAPVFKPSSVPAASGATDAEWLKTLRTMLQATLPPALQYRAIEELRIEATPEAAAILLEVLADAQELSPATLQRICSALAEMPYLDIPLRLLEILEKTPDRKAVQPILTALGTISGQPEQSLLNTPAVLPLIHTTTQRKKTIEWWWEFYTQRYPYLSGAAGSTAAGSVSRPVLQPGTGPSAGSLESLGPAETTQLKLLAAGAFFAARMAEALHDLDWQTRPGEPPAHLLGDKIPVYQDPGGQLRRNLQTLVGECLRLARTHPKAGSFAVRLDMLELRYQTDRLTESSPLRDLHGQLEAIGLLVEILIEQNASGRPPQKLLGAIRRQRQAALAAAGGMRALRESGIYNLILWEILADSQPTAPAAAPGK